MRGEKSWKIEKKNRPMERNCIYIHTVYRYITWKKEKRVDRSDYNIGIALRCIKKIIFMGEGGMVETDQSIESESESTLKSCTLWTVCYHIWDSET